MNKNMPASSPVEQKLKALYAIDPPEGFTNQLEQNLLAKKRPGTERPARLAWMTNLRRGGSQFALAGVVILMLVAAFFATPVGRAWAQEVMHFFTRAGSDAQPTIPLQGSGTFDFNLTAAQAAEQAGFTVQEPGWLPEGVSFQGALFDADPGLVRLRYYNADIYSPDQVGSSLILTEQVLPRKVDCVICEYVGASAQVEAVQVGNVQGEYVMGVWKADDNGNWVWTAEPWMQTLRWQANGMAYELSYMGDPQEVTQEDLITIAGSLK